MYVYFYVYVCSPCHVSSYMEGEMDSTHSNNLNYLLTTQLNTPAFQFNNQNNRTAWLNKNSIILENGQRYYRYQYLNQKYLQSLSTSTTTTSTTSTKNTQLELHKQLYEQGKLLPRLRLWDVYERGLRWEGMREKVE